MQVIVYQFQPVTEKFKGLTLCTSESSVIQMASAVVNHVKATIATVDEPAFSVSAPEVI
jgi:hypothetical protein